MKILFSGNFDGVYDFVGAVWKDRSPGERKINFACDVRAKGEYFIFKLKTFVLRSDENNLW